MLWKKYFWGHISTFVPNFEAKRAQNMLKKTKIFFLNVNQNKLYFPILLSEQQGDKIVSP